MGCNLAAFFTGIPQFSLHAWFFAVATAIGSYFGAKFTLLPLFRIPVKMTKVSAASPLTQKPLRPAAVSASECWSFSPWWHGRSAPP
jgi:uncharacterized membrane protein YedE/YeeE